jgi:hypothetical protein
MENSINDNYITIRGSYFSNTKNINDNIINNYNKEKTPFENDVFKNIQDNIINNYNIEKKYFENEVYMIQLNNKYLLNIISFLEKRCTFVNITHSNTRNFIGAHYKELKHLLDKTIFKYKSNLYNIYLLNEKIYGINVIINNLK